MRAREQHRRDRRHGEDQIARDAPSRGRAPAPAGPTGRLMTSCRNTAPHSPPAIERRTSTAAASWRSRARRGTMRSRAAPSARRSGSPAAGARRQSLPRRSSTPPRPQIAHTTLSPGDRSRAAARPPPRRTPVPRGRWPHARGGHAPILPARVPSSKRPGTAGQARARGGSSGPGRDRRSARCGSAAGPSSSRFSAPLAGTSAPASPGQPPRWAPGLHPSVAMATTERSRWRPITSAMARTGTPSSAAPWSTDPGRGGLQRGGRDGQSSRCTRP